MPVARERLSQYLLAHGYTRSGNAFVRGSVWGTLASSNPKKWAIKVSMDSVADGIFRVVFDINTAGLRIFESVRTYWEAELEATGRVLRGEAAPDLSTHARKVASSSLREALYVVTYSTVFAFGVALIQILARRHGIELPSGSAGIGAAFGLAVGLRMWPRSSWNADARTEDSRK
jgi:hypothetical protein